MATTYAAVEFPPPTLAGPACQACEGLGVTGEQYHMPTGEHRVLVVDVFCPECGGCGGASDPEHQDCAGLHHWDDDRNLDDEDLDDAFLNDEPVCPSCGGREWNAVQGFPDPPTEIKVLRVPCGCTTNRARTWTDDQERGR